MIWCRTCALQWALTSSSKSGFAPRVTVQNVTSAPNFRNRKARSTVHMLVVGHSSLNVLKSLVTPSPFTIINTQASPQSLRDTIFVRNRPGCTLGERSLSKYRHRCAKLLFAFSPVEALPNVRNAVENTLVPGTASIVRAISAKPRAERLCYCGLLRLRTRRRLVIAAHAAPVIAARHTARAPQAIPKCD